MQWVFLLHCLQWLTVYLGEEAEQDDKENDGGGDDTSQDSLDGAEHQQTGRALCFTAQSDVSENQMKMKEMRLSMMRTTTMKEEIPKRRTTCNNSIQVNNNEELPQPPHGKSVKFHLDVSDTESQKAGDDNEVIPDSLNETLKMESNQLALELHKNGQWAHSLTYDNPYPPFVSNLSWPWAAKSQKTASNSSRKMKCTVWFQHLWMKRNHCNNWNHCWPSTLLWSGQGFPSINPDWADFWFSVRVGNPGSKVHAQDVPSCHERIPNFHPEWMTSQMPMLGYSMVSL